MEQHLLPLPPIFQGTDFSPNMGQNHEDYGNDDYYYEEEGDSFEWPSQFCADPLWVNFNFLNISNIKNESK